MICIYTYQIIATKKYDLIVFFEANRRFGYRFQGLIEKLRRCQAKRVAGLTILTTDSMSFLPMARAASTNGLRSSSVN
jgi:hypothetical protein